MDPGLTIAARNRAPEQFTGRRPSKALEKAFLANHSGIFAETSLDGAAIYMVFVRSPDTDWNITVAIPAEEIDGPIRKSMLLMTGAGLLASGGGIGAATFIAARIRRARRAEQSLNESLERLVDDRTSAWRQSEEQLRQAQKMEALGQLTAGIAHDFNNHLGVILGNLDLVDVALSDRPEAKQQIEAAITAVEQGAALTRQLLAFSRKQALQPRRTETGALVARMSENISPGHYVMLAVTDNGTGMTPEVKERVFEPFFTTKQVGKGSGLGLSMVYGFVRQSGGFLRLGSEPGRGTTVRIFLPVAADVEEAGAPGHEVPVVRRGQDETVLVVEDNPGLSVTTVTALEGLGYKPITAKNATEAMLVLTKTRDVALLVTDIVLPDGKDGFELAKDARALYPFLAVLSLSGYNPAERIPTEASGQPINFLAKPFRMSELAARVAGALARPEPASRRTAAAN